MTETFETIIQNGTVVNHDGRGKVDVGISDDKIAAIGDLAQADAGTVINAKGLHVLAGVIDTQVHLREPGPTYKEDLESGSRGAVLGGVTGVFEMPNTNPTIQWDDKAGSGNKWNIPVGFSAAKMTKIGNMPLRIEFGVEYSAVRQDDYGEVARIKFNFIPLVSRPINKAIFGE